MLCLCAESRRGEERALCACVEVKPARGPSGAGGEGKTSPYALPLRRAARHRSQGWKVAGSQVGCLWCLPGVYPSAWGEGEKLGRQTRATAGGLPLAPHMCLCIYSLGPCVPVCPRCRVTLVCIWGWHTPGSQGQPCLRQEMHGSVTLSAGKPSRDSESTQAHSTVEQMGQETDVRTLDPDPHRSDLDGEISFSFICVPRPCGIWSYSSGMTQTTPDSRCVPRCLPSLLPPPGPHPLLQYLVHMGSENCPQSLLSSHGGS